MKKYIIFTMIGALVLSICVASFAFMKKTSADTVGKYGDAAKKDMEAMLKKDEQDKAVLEKYKDSSTSTESRAKIQKMLDESWQDIKETYAINEDNYIKFNFVDIANPPDEVKSILDDNEIHRIIHEFSCSMPTQTTEPVVLISKDRKEVLFAAKKVDGENIVFKATKNGDSWEKYESKAQGRAISSMNNMD